MRLMYDSTRPSAIPPNAGMVAGYVDGRYAWKPEDWARFPTAVKVEISALGTDLGTVVDVEPGCVWPPQNAVPWVVRARARGIDPTVYCNWQNDLPSVKAAFVRAGVPEPHYWVAKYDGFAEVPAGTIGKQYRAPEAPRVAPSPGHYDMSAIADYWPGVDEMIDPKVAEDIRRIRMGIENELSAINGRVEALTRGLDTVPNGANKDEQVLFWGRVFDQLLPGDPDKDGNPYSAEAYRWIVDRARDDEGQNARLDRLESLVQAIAINLGVKLP